MFYVTAPIYYLWVTKWGNFHVVEETLTSDKKPRTRVCICYFSKLQIPWTIIYMSVISSQEILFICYLLVNFLGAGLKPRASHTLGKQALHHWAISSCPKKEGNYWKHLVNSVTVFDDTLLYEVLVENTRGIYAVHFCFVLFWIFKYKFLSKD